MQMMGVCWRTNRLALLAAITVALSLWVATPTAAQSISDPIRVVRIPKGAPITLGGYWVLSGPDTSLGLDEYRGAQIAVADLNGKLLNHPIRLIAEDEQCSSEGGQVAATKLASNQNVVVVIGPACSSAAAAGAPILWKAGLSSIGTSAGAPRLTAPDRPDGYKGYLRTIYNVSWDGTDTANWASKVLKVQRVATIHDGSHYAKDLVTVFQKRFRELGGEICADEAIAPTDVDMRPMLTKVATCKPELIYFPLFVAAAAQVARQSAEISGLNAIALVATDSLLTKDFLSAAGPAAKGVKLATTAMEPEAQGEGYNALREKYKAKFGEYPIQGFHGHAYDAVMIAAEALKKVAVTDKEGNTYVPLSKLRDALFATKNHKGVTGNLSCNQYGDCGVRKFAVYEFVSANPDSFKVGENPKRIYPDRFN